MKSISDQIADIKKKKKKKLFSFPGNSFLVELFIYTYILFYPKKT
jgi:hypothetical protein